jgi:uncharacterized protein YydD (DUF2326 family)
VKLEEAIAQIDRSLVERSDLSPELVSRIYEEAKLALPDLVKRRLDEVTLFRKELQEKRAYRLTRERQLLNNELRTQLERVSALSSQLDEKLRYLSETRALDEYTAVHSELGELRQRIAKLEESNEIRGRVERELKKIEREQIEEDIRTADYLEKSKPLIESASAVFRGFAKELYGSRPSGLNVTIDDGHNQLRYRIEAHIRADAAEGINEAKIFCFDMTVLRLRRGHRIDFLAHDSTLFGPVDPRQRIAMFRIADRVCSELGVQYIATLNSHDITSMREDPLVDAEEVDNLINDQSIVLRLTDASPKERLLGIDLDMDYTQAA